MMCCNTSLLLHIASLQLQEAGNCRRCLPPLLAVRRLPKPMRLLSRRTLWLNFDIALVLVGRRCRLFFTRFLIQLLLPPRLFLHGLSVGDVTEHLHASWILLGREHPVLLIDRYAY